MSVDYLQARPLISCCSTADTKAFLKANKLGRRYNTFIKAVQHSFGTSTDILSLPSRKIQRIRAICLRALQLLFRCGVVWWMMETKSGLSHKLRNPKKLSGTTKNIRLVVSVDISVVASNTSLIMTLLGRVPVGVKWHNSTLCSNRDKHLQPLYPQYRNNRFWSYLVFIYEWNTSQYCDQAWHRNHKLLLYVFNTDIESLAAPFVKQRPG